MRLNHDKKSGTFPILRVFGKDVSKNQAKLASAP